MDGPRISIASLNFQIYFQSFAILSSHYLGGRQVPQKTLEQRFEDNFQAAVRLSWAGVLFASHILWMDRRYLPLTSLPYWAL